MGDRGRSLGPGKRDPTLEVAQEECWRVRGLHNPAQVIA